MIDVYQIKETVKAIRERAILIACAVKNYERGDVEEVIVYEDEIEVKFSAYLVGHDEESYYLSYENLMQDLDNLIKRVKLARKDKEQNRKEKLKQEILRVLELWEIKALYPPVWHGYFELQNAITIETESKELKRAMLELKKENRVKSETMYEEDDYQIAEEGWVIKK